MVNAVRVRAREEGGLRSLLLSGSQAWLPVGPQPEGHALLGARRAICAAQPVAFGAMSTPGGPRVGVEGAVAGHYAGVRKKRDFL